LPATRIREDGGFRIGESGARIVNGRRPVVVKRRALPGRRLGALVPLCACAALSSGIAFASATAAPTVHTFTFYTVATGAQYLNNGDDRGRGIHDNPFDAATSKLKPKLSERGDGPFPGDVAVFTLNLFANATLQKNIGSGAYTCYYNYAKHALCEAYYELNGRNRTSTLLAAGSVDFDNTARFDMIITGGTQTYRDARGALSAAPSGTAERVQLRLVK
jgi:hypothetical protein